jgi:predicted N-acetyltransferase YhbS
LKEYNSKIVVTGGTVKVQYLRAELADYDDLMDFGNYVFSHAHGPVDFPSLLPKLYRREYFMEGIHYLAKEDGRIRAAVGAYPLEMNILGNVLPGRGIGMVSVHPYARSRGYMRTLMETALSDMADDGTAFSCLGGWRQRYEYFGFSPTGTQLVFECRRSNIRHTGGNGFSPALSVRQLTGEDGLEEIYRFHQSKAARIERSRGKFFDILSSWKNRVFILTNGGGFAGYLIYDDGDNTVPEINLLDPRRAVEAAAGFLDYLEKKSDRDRISVCAQPWESAKIEALSAFAEDCRISTAYSFAVFNWPLLVSALLRLKIESGQTLPDGEAVFRIGGGNTKRPESCFRITVRRGDVQVLPGGGEAGEAVVLDPLQAQRLFFSPLSPWDSPLLRRNPFLRGVLPLPLFFEAPDGV